MRPRDPTHGHDRSLHGAGTPYVVVAHHPDGPRVTEYATKAAAHAHAKQLRSKGVLSFAHPKAMANKFGMVPPGAKSSPTPRARGSHYSPKYGR